MAQTLAAVPHPACEHYDNALLESEKQGVTIWENLGSPAETALAQADRARRECGLLKSAARHYLNPRNARSLLAVQKFNQISQKHVLSEKGEKGQDQRITRHSVRI